MPQVPPADGAAGPAGPGYVPNGEQPPYPQGGDPAAYPQPNGEQSSYGPNGDQSAYGQNGGPSGYPRPPAYAPGDAAGYGPAADQAYPEHGGQPVNGTPGASGVPGPSGTAAMPLVPGATAQDGTLPDDAGPVGPAGSGGSGDGKTGEDESSGSSSGAKQQRAFWKELPLLVVIALVLALLIKTFLVQAFSIPSDSMQNTLQKGDRVLVDKLTPWFGSNPSRGEVVVFHDPGGWLPENPPPSSNPLVRGIQKGLSFIGLMPSADEKDLIKRVIGVGGDTVQCNGTGPVVVNGKPLNEPYVFPGNTPCSKDAPFKVTVPKGRIWVMGDHRQDSLDSRYHMTLPGGGTVADSDVVGRAIVVAWPINRWTALSIPGTFSQPGINAAGTAAPAAVGLAGAVPLVLIRRRRLLKRLDAGALQSAVPAEPATKAAAKTPAASASGDERPGDEG
ncbi:signal peptidase I [Actinacidiphila acididurans]|uniref:signal peptidase I n=1 Tax=Actinacidiphila acididurans TaxID=2784346 RepID=UPI003FD6E3C4